MPNESLRYKAVASALVILTISVIAGIVTMIILYKPEISTTNLPTLTSDTTGRPVIRLPKSLIPHSYKVFLQPYLYTKIIEVANVTSPNQTRLFTGNSTVIFHCVQKTTTIYLHSKDLTVYSPVVMNTKQNEAIGVSRMNHHEDESDFLEIQLNETLEAGEDYSLFLAFKGEMPEYAAALYGSRYHEGNPAHENDTSTERFIAATKLEPTYARTVFPCFDEPEMKAVFNVTIIHRRDTIALGNEEKSDSNVIDDDWQYTSFHPTPKMSTYLFAFTVSEFTSIPSLHERVDIKTFARPDAIAAGQAQYAASVTGKILTFYENYFEIDYQLRTLDQIALPDSDFAAMENWGLITYQEEGLLYEEGVSSPLQKQVIVSLIAHELAHQWFGNLVTMKWWNDIWLNEGFATYMSYFAVDHAEPSLNLKETFVIHDLSAAFEEDVQASSHPLSPPEEDVQMTSEINQMFDTITYSKGAMVLRMLADIMGERVFRKGIKMYLSHFRYNNTDQGNLWEYMQKAVDEDAGHTKIAMVMEPWTNQSGYPLITINTTSGEINQKHFLLNDSSESSLWWYVPVRVMSDTSESSLVWLTDTTEMKPELISKSGEWILANINCTGYYRVNYNQENWDRLLTQLETDLHRIPLMNRWQLIDDAFILARAKLVDVTLALNTTRFLRNERSFIPWDTAVRNLQYFVSMFDRSEVYGPMQAYLREQVKGLYNYLRKYTDNAEVPTEHSLQLNQLIAIKLACSSGLPECLEMASKMFANWMNNSTYHIPLTLRPVIYCQAIAAGGKKEWEFAWNKLNSNDTSDKEGLYDALSCTKKVWLLNRYLEYTLDPEKTSVLDVASTIRQVANNVVGNALAWNFLREHWKYIKKEATPYLISGVTRRFSKQFELDELMRFAADNNLGLLATAAIEQTKVNIQWVNEHKDIILEWFEGVTAP